MSGFTGTSGRRFSDSQRKAMFAGSNRFAMNVGFLDKLDQEHRGLRPVTPTSAELVTMSYMSRPSAWSIDVDKMRDVVKKQYPGADVDSDVVMLPPDKYMKVALEENPGREKEAIMSNGFYSPTTDKTYLEADDRLNTTRALLHEYVHDMSDEGVEDYMLNEGYADFVAKELMTEELKLPESVVNKTIGYPKEVRRVENLVNRYGRKNVDMAFLIHHTLGYLDELDNRERSCGRNT